jgi:hypothetical protein
VERKACWGEEYTVIADADAAAAPVGRTAVTGVFRLLSHPPAVDDECRRDLASAEHHPLCSTRASQHRCARRAGSLADDKAEDRRIQSVSHSLSFALSIYRSVAYDDGRQQLLLCLHGLIPISYRGANYHIPIAVWLARDYPREPPIAYVVPTRDMLVRPGPHVEPSGRCSVAYSQNWERKPEVSTLPLDRVPSMY